MKLVASALILGSALSASATNLTLSMVADDFFEAYVSTSDAVQGTQFAAQTNTWQAGTTTGTVALTTGMTNYLHVRARDVFGAPSMIVGVASLSDGGFVFANNSSTLETNTTDWQVSLTGFGSGYFTPTDIGANGSGPWGTQSGIPLTARRIWSNQTTGEQYFTVEITSVPEPGTMAALGLGAVALLRRRKK